METDPPSSNQVCKTTEDHVTSHVRTYECIFCKRGFTNAQALGGHMNIHRRDRAKFKQPSIYEKPSLDIKNKNNPSHPPPFPDYNKLELESTEDRRCNIKWPWNIPSEDDAISSDDNHVGQLRQLPLFVERPSSSEDRKSSSSGGGCEEVMMQSSQSSSGVELDLELRLGPEPCNTSTTGTVEFF